MLGPRGANQFDYWMRFIAYTEDDNPWTLYESLFAVWASRFRGAGDDEFRLCVDAAVVELRFRSTTDVNGAKTILDRQRQRFLSDWDFALYSERGLLQIPEGSDYFPFVDAVVLAIGMAKFQDFWNWLVSFAGPLDVLAIASAAKERSVKLNVPYCSPEDLPRLRNRGVAFEL